MARPKSNKSHHSSNHNENKMVRNLDQLSMMQDLYAGILPELKRDLANGVDAIAIAKKYASLAQARVVTTALTDEDSGRALVAAKDILDRAHGKATETKVLKHGMADASEAEIDAVINSKLRDVTDSNKEGDAADE